MILKELSLYFNANIYEEVDVVMNDEENCHLPTVSSSAMVSTLPSRK